MLQRGRQVHLAACFQKCARILRRPGGSEQRDRDDCPHLTQDLRGTSLLAHGGSRLPASVSALSRASCFLPGRCLLSRPNEKQEPTRPIGCRPIGCRPIRLSAHPCRQVLTKEDTEAAPRMAFFSHRRCGRITTTLLILSLDNVPFLENYRKKHSPKPLFSATNWRTFASFWQDLAESAAICQPLFAQFVAYNHITPLFAIRVFQHRPVNN